MAPKPIPLHLTTILLAATLVSIILLLFLRQQSRLISQRKKSEKALQKAHAELEQRVQQRTHELQQANIRLRKLDEMKSAFLSTVSHDIRTPLTSIMGFAKLTLRDFNRHFAPGEDAELKLQNKGARIRHNLQTILGEGEGESVDFRNV